MDTAKRYSLYNGELVLNFPIEFIVNKEKKLPDGMMQTYPDYIFTSDTEIYVSVSRRPGNHKGAEEYLREIIPALRAGEEDFQSEGAWKRNIHHLETGKLHYSTIYQGHRWSHMLATFEFAEQQYLIMIYVKMIQKEIWEILFDNILEKMEVRYG